MLKGSITSEIQGKAPIILAARQYLTNAIKRYPREVGCSSW
jgi:hypothetical protein